MTNRDTETLYTARLNRYLTALRNDMPDRVPIRPFAAEFTAKYAGYTCQEVTHDYRLAFDAARKCAAEFDWDAVVSNMVYVWTGLTEAIGLRYYGVPGIDLPPNVGFQYREPPAAEAFMRADEYDALIADPTGFLYETWLPRVARDVVALGAPSTRRNNLSFVKGGMAMLRYFLSFGEQHARLRSECGTPAAIAGILKAPFDILADKLRGYVGLTKDMFTQPDKVLAACEALQPHLLHAALSSADPQGQAPVGFWMHRGCVPFVTPAQFESHYWPTLRPIIEELWRHGHQTLFYAEGDWNHHLERFAELPERSIIFHADRSDVFAAKRILGEKFCISGGIPNALLSYGAPDEVRAYCRKVIEEAGRDGGYILDASAIIQNDATVENMRALTDAGREYGAYSRGHSTGETPRSVKTNATSAEPSASRNARHPLPGECIAWEEKRSEWPIILGDDALVRRVWEEIEQLGNMYIWHCLLSF